MKAYIVYACSPCSDGADDVGVFLDIEAGNEYVHKMNKPREEEMKIYNECNECIGDKYDEDEKVFKFKDTCKRCKLGQDRYGTYCENELTDYYSLETDSYFGREIDVLG